MPAAPVTVQATGAAGIYADAHPGLTLRLGVTVDLNVFEIIKVHASGELRLNTTSVDRSPGGVLIGAKSFRLALTGQIKILEVIRFSASFLIQVGGGNVTVGSEMCIRDRPRLANLKPNRRALTSAEKATPNAYCMMPDSTG